MAVTSAVPVVLFDNEMRTQRPIRECGERERDSNELPC